MYSTVFYEYLTILNHNMSGISTATRLTEANRSNPGAREFPDALTRDVEASRCRGRGPIDLR